MANVAQKLDFDWNYVEEVDENEVHLVDENRIYSPAIKISKQEVLDQHKPQRLLVGMERSGWDDYREIYRTFSPDELWEEQKYQMIHRAWDKITRVWIDEFEEIVKIEKPC